MPPYAGFKDLNDYLEKRCQRENISYKALAEDLGWIRAYIHGLRKGDHRPSRSRADAIARYFGDDRRIVRVLAGLELPPDNAPDDPFLAEVVALAPGLPAAGRRELAAYCRFLLDKHRTRHP